MKSAREHSFDPYLRWLGIRDPVRPVNYYRLLGVEENESDPDVIATAADRQMSHVRRYQSGPYAQQSQELLNELASARLVLLDRERRAEYDRENRLHARNVDSDSEAGSSRILSTRQFVAILMVLLALLLGFQFFYWDQGPVIATNGPPESVAVIMDPETSQGSSVSFPTPGPVDSSQGGLSTDVENHPTGTAVDTEASPQEESSSQVQRQIPPQELPTFVVLDVPIAPIPFPRNESIWADFKLAISERDIEAAARELIESASVIETQNDEKDYQVLSEILECSKQFWLAVEQAFEGAVASGTLLEYGSLPPVTIESIDSKRILLLSTNGSRVEYPSRHSELPAIIAANLAELVLPKTLESHRVLGTFWAFDQQGNAEIAARQHWRYLHDGDRSEQYVATWRSATRTKRQVVNFSEPSSAEFERLVLAIEQELNINPKSPSADAPERLIALADRQSKGTTKRYVGLRRAAEYATKSGRVDIGMLVIRRLDDEFDSVSNVDRLQWLNQLLRHGNDDNARSIVKYAMSQAVRSIRTDSYADACDFAAIAVRGSGRSESDLRGKASRLKARAIVLKREYMRASIARKKLSLMPDDPASNRVVGEFLCLTKGDFAKGLPLLAKSDSRYRELASVSLESSLDVEQKLNAADRWREVAAQLGAFERKVVLSHVAKLYRGLSAELHGDAKKRLLDRLDATSGSLEAP